jgi:transmembrane sensor
LVAGAFAYYHQYVDPVFSQVIATPRGGSLSARLPDGTGTELDTATRLQVTYQRGRRLISLAEGPALFSVQPDSGRPFIVTAGSVRVRVVGTRVSVRHTPEIPGEPGVAVDEGWVRVKPERGIAQVWLGALGWRPGGALLSAGERLVTGADGTPGPVGPLPEAGIASWREDRVSFVDAPSAPSIRTR